MPMPLAAAGFVALDWVVLFAYFVGITGFGLWVARRIHTSGDYFLGERKLPWWVMIGQAFGTGTHAENPVAQTGATYHSGFATIWFQWKNMLITPFYWLMSPWYRRSERTTIGEIVGDRYGSGLALLYAVYAILFFVFSQGVMLKGAAKVISVATGGQFSPNGVVVAMTAAFILYSFFGGIVAAAYTDFVQGFLIILLSFMLIPLGLAAVGGFAGLHASVPPGYFEVYNAQVSGIDTFTVLMLTVNGLVGITAQPHMLSMNATGRTERAGRVGQTYGNFVKRFCTIGWALTGLIVAALVVKHGTRLDDPEHAFGYACRELLGPGLTGLMAACVLAANMSTSSNFMVNSGALFTKNIYRDYVNPAADDRRTLAVGRVSGLLLTLLGVGFALVVQNVLHAFLFTETMAAFVGIMFLGGILWPRANRYGGLAGIVVAFTVYYAVNYAAAGQLMLVYKWTAGPFAWAMLAGTGSFILVSLLTRPEDPARIARFFDAMRRSSDAGATGPDGQRALAASRGQDLILLDAPGWFRAGRWHGFWGRYREDVSGFALAWVSVVALIAIAWAMLQIGK